MTKDWQEKFYKAVGEILSKERVRQGMTIHDLSKKTSQQYNTIDRIEKGKPFYFFHVVWITDYLGISVDELLLDLAPLTRADARRDIINRKNDIKNKRGFHGVQKTFDDLIGEEDKEESFDDII